MNKVCRHISQKLVGLNSLEELNNEEQEHVEHCAHCSELWQWHAKSLDLGRQIAQQRAEIPHKTSALFLQQLHRRMEEKHQESTPLFLNWKWGISFAASAAIVLWLATPLLTNQKKSTLPLHNKMIKHRLTAETSRSLAKKKAKTKNDDPFDISKEEDPLDEAIRTLRAQLTLATEKEMRNSQRTLTKNKAERSKIAQKNTPNTSQKEDFDELFFPFSEDKKSSELTELPNSLAILSQLMQDKDASAPNTTK